MIGFIWEIDRCCSSHDILSIYCMHVGCYICDMDANQECFFINFFNRQGVVEISRCWGIDGEDHFIYWFVKGCRIQCNRCLRSLLIMEIIQSMLIQESFTLSINSHCLSKYLMYIGQRKIVIPNSKGKQYINIF